MLDAEKLGAKLRDCPLTDTLENHEHKNFIKEYFPVESGIEPVYSFQRHTQMTQNRMPEPILLGSQLVDLTLLKFSLPQHFSLRGNYKGVAKYCAISKAWSEIDLGEVRSYMINRYVGSCRSKMVKIWDVVADTDPMTSVGYPMNQTWKLKRDWISSMTFLSDMNSFLSRVDEEPAGVCTSVFNSFPKNEALSLLKLMQDELRQISGSDARLNLALGQFHKDFNDQFVADWRNGHSRAGIPIQHGGWHWLYCKHSQRGRFKRAMEIDIKKMDSSMPRELMQFIFTIRSMAMQKLPAHLYARWWKLVCSVIDGYIILPDGVVIQKRGGNVSGNYDTLVLNTLVAEIYMLYAWMVLAHEQGLVLGDFDDLNVLSVVGDDILCSVDPEIESWFSPQAVIKVLADVGIKAEGRWALIENAQFLSHEFRLFEYGGRKCVVPYPTNCHKALANILYPETRHVRPVANYPILLARVLAQRNRFFADAWSTTGSYWTLLDAIADLYRGLAKDQREVFPADYATAMALDVPSYIVAELYCVPYEGAGSSNVTALSMGLRAAERLFGPSPDDEYDGQTEETKK